MKSSDKLSTKKDKKYNKQSQTKPVAEISAAQPDNSDSPESSEKEVQPTSQSDSSDTRESHSDSSDTDTTSQSAYDNSSADNQVKTDGAIATILTLDLLKGMCKQTDTTEHKQTDTQNKHAPSYAASDCTALQDLLAKHRQELQIMRQSHETDKQSLQSKPADAVSVNSHLTDLHVNSMDTEEKNQIRQTYTLGVKSDWQGIHSYQLTEKPLGKPQQRPKWCYGSNYNATLDIAECSDFLWYCKQFSSMSPKEMPYNHCIEQIEQWEVGNIGSAFCSPAGWFHHERDYQMYLVNSELSIVIVESGLLKMNGMTFMDFAQRTRGHCVDTFVKYFPDLPNIQYSWYKNLANEIIWQSTVPLSNVLDYMLTNGIRSRECLKIVKDQPFMTRIVACFFEIHKLHQVCCIACANTVARTARCNALCQ